VAASLRRRSRCHPTRRRQQTQRLYSFAIAANLKMQTRLAARTEPHRCDALILTDAVTLGDQYALGMAVS